MRRSLALALLLSFTLPLTAQAAEPVATSRVLAPFADDPNAEQAPPLMRDTGGFFGTSGDIRLALLTEPTDRYAHAVLGDGIEAGGMAVSVGIMDADAEALHAWITLAEPFVFEDVAPRIADLDGDGRNEVVTILSERGVGASLAVLGLRDRELRILARTPAIDTANRWLNPAGIADFDGDGVQDVALVETPHIGGELQLWSGASLLAGAPHMLAAKRGYSNHAIGSRELDLAEVVETDDGPVLIVPSADRRSLETVRYQGGTWTTLATVALEDQVVGPLTKTDGMIETGVGGPRVPLTELMP